MTIEELNNMHPIFHSISSIAYQPIRATLYLGQKFTAILCSTFRLINNKVNLIATRLFGKQSPNLSKNDSSGSFTGHTSQLKDDKAKLRIDNLNKKILLDNSTPPKGSDNHRELHSNDLDKKEKAFLHETETQNNEKENQDVKKNEYSSSIVNDPNCADIQIKEIENYDEILQTLMSEEPSDDLLKKVRELRSKWWEEEVACTNPDVVVALMAFQKELIKKMDEKTFPPLINRYNEENYKWSINSLDTTSPLSINILASYYTNFNLHQKRKLSLSLLFKHYLSEEPITRLKCHGRTFENLKIELFSIKIEDNRPVARFTQRFKIDSSITGSQEIEVIHTHEGQNLSERELQLQNEMLLLCNQYDNEAGQVFIQNPQEPSDVECYFESLKEHIISVSKTDWMVFINKNNSSEQRERALSNLSNIYFWYKQRLKSIQDLVETCNQQSELKKLQIGQNTFANVHPQLTFTKDQSQNFLTISFQKENYVIPATSMKTISTCDPSKFQLVCSQLNLY